MPLKILLIDDDDPVRTVLARTLERAGHSVAQAHNGRDGLNQLDQSRFDLVITDIVMPEMEGIEMLMEIRKRNFSGKVLAMSGGGAMGSGTNLHVAKLMGARMTLTKPFSPEDFLAAVDQLASEETGAHGQPLTAAQ
jgi:DNA-binding response OmpR family regulator